jgi:hypothetical protein
MPSIDELKLTLLKSGIASPLSILGCTPEEIREVEEFWGVPLPAAYREFLAKMGRAAGDLFNGSDVHYPDMLGMREGLAEILEGHPYDLDLPDDAIIFLQTGGYEWLWIRSSEGGDPSVYELYEVNGPPAVVRWDHFTDCVAHTIEDIRAMRSRFGPPPFSRRRLISSPTACFAASGSPFGVRRIFTSALSP